MQLWQIQKRSQILTGHRINNSSSVPLLPAISSNLSNQINSRSLAKKLKVYSIKTKQQLMKEDRSNNLIKLKTNLHEEYIQNLQEIKRLSVVRVEDDYVTKLQLKMEESIKHQTLMNEHKEQQHIDNEKILFFDCCKQLIALNEAVNKYKNQHFKTKLLIFIDSLIFKKDLLQILSELSSLSNLEESSISNLQALFKKYGTLFRNCYHLRKQLKKLSKVAKQVLLSFNKNKFSNLNVDIQRVKREVEKDAMHVGEQLNRVTNWKIRKSIFQSLENIQFNFSANKNIYQEFTERVKQQFS